MTSEEMRQFSADYVEIFKNLHEHVLRSIVELFVKYPEAKAEAYPAMVRKFCVTMIDTVAETEDSLIRIAQLEREAHRRKAEDNSN